jgi:alpha-L-fucosidase
MNRTRVWLLAAVCAAVLGPGCGTATAPTDDAKQPLEATWDSLSNYECPDWFRDAKFGIYAHWGPYSAAMGDRNTDWYSRNMYKPDHPNNTFHVKTYGPVLKFGYKDLIPSFTAEKFNAEEWADLYVESGARFAGPVGEHADGFAMWDSKVNPWNAVKMGPKRDVVGEMAAAVRSRGLKLVVSMHHQWLWGWYPTWDENTDAGNPANASLYGPKYPATAQGRLVNGRFENMYADPLPSAEFQATWLEKVKEVVTQYQPDLLWFDNRMQLLSEKTRREMLAFYYNHARAANQDVVLTYKGSDLELGTATLDLERSRMPNTYPEPWLTDTSVSASSWAYANDLQYYSADRLVDDLVDIVSKNGSLLLNVAPHPDGTIPVEQQERLRAMGKWLKVNGEAIYGSRPWLIFGEGPTKTPVGHLSDRGFDGFSAGDIRFTRQGDTLYAIALGWPESGNTLTIRALGTARYSDEISGVTLLGHSGNVGFVRTPEGLVIQLPHTPAGEYAFVFRINR